MLASPTVLPAALLAPFPPDDQAMIAREAAASPSFSAAVTVALQQRGGPEFVAQSARKAIANELNPSLYPESAGQWPVLRKMTSDLASSMPDTVAAQAAKLSLNEKIKYLQTVTRTGIPTPRGMSGFLGTAAPAAGASSALSTLGVVGGLMGGIAAAGATIYTAHVLASTQKDIAKIQAGAVTHNADVALQIAQAQAAMAGAQARIEEARAQQMAIQQSSPIQTSTDSGAMMPYTADQVPSGMVTQGPITAPSTAARPVISAKPTTADQGVAPFVIPAVVGGGAAILYAMLHGFGADRYEVAAYRALPMQLQELLAEEAKDNPAFLGGYLIPTLRSSNPREQIIADIAYEIHMADSMGMGYLGKSFFKRIVKRIRTDLIKIPVKVIKATTPKFIKKIAKKVGKPIMKTWHKYGAIIIGVIGGILSPFTGGASVAAATLLIAAKQMYDAKKAATAALRAAKKDAGQQQAAADAASAQVAQQVDAFYQQNQQWFIDQGITPDKWAQLTLDQKIGIINAGASGTLPPGAQQVGATQVDPTTGVPLPGQTVPPGAVVTPPPQTTGPTTGTIVSAPGAPTSAGPIDVPYGGGGSSGGGGGGGGGGASYGGAESTDDSGGAAPAIQTAGGNPADKGGAPAAPTGQYDVVVEGQKVASVGSIDDATKAALAFSKPGDRVEILFNGQSTGLRLRTSQGTTSVPPDTEAQIRAMTHDQVVTIVANAEKQLGITSDAPSSGGISVGGVVAAIVAVGIAVAAGGKKH